MIESLVSEGLAAVRQEGIRSSPELGHLVDLESAARAAGKGKWASTGMQEHIREIKWTVENPRQLVDKFKGKPVKAVVEHVRDGSTIRAYLLPDFYHITLMVSGIRVISSVTFQVSYGNIKLCSTSCHSLQDLNWIQKANLTLPTLRHWLRKLNSSLNHDFFIVMSRSSSNLSTITTTLAPSSIP